MKRTAVLLALFLAAALAPHRAMARDDSGADFFVVVHADNPVTEVSRADLSQIFMKKTTVWDHGAEIVPFDQAADSPTRAAFSQAVLQRPIPSIESYWQRTVFTGRATPPAVLASDEGVLESVRRDPGAVGYVSGRAELMQGVKPLPVFDLPELANPRNSDRIVAEQGEIRLLLTGSCGEAGRHAVLQNRHDWETISASVERSTWIRDRFRSSRHVHYALAPGAEEQLGCTEVSSSAEERFALTEVSNASRSPRHARLEHHEPHHGGHATVEIHESGPPRDFITFVESGVCGRGHEGQKITVVNEHSEQEIAVTIEQVLKIDGRLRTRSLRHHRLRPGGEKELGCNRDGSAVYEYQLLEARR